MEKESIKFIFFGTGDFAARILDCLHKNSLCTALIVTTPDKPRGRNLKLLPNPVKDWANKNNKVVVQPDNLNDIRNVLAGAYDVFVIADYGKIIPKHILNIPNYGCLNIHPSLLPKFRGSSPIQSFILSGEEKTGVTIILMDEEIDHGPIIASEKLKVKSEKLYYKELEEKLAELGGQLLIETLPKWIEGKIKPQEQDHSKATYTKKIAKEDGLIKSGDSPEIIERKVRAFTPWPGAYFFTNNKRIIITEAELKNGKLVIKRIKPEGKNEMPLSDFLKGNKDIEPQIQKLTN